nr:hypothetical protein [Kribbella qitaiheensis]
MAGAAPVCTMPGPPTQSTFCPFAFASRIPSATCLTSTRCGFSLDTSESMKPNDSSSCETIGGVTRTPWALEMIRIPAFTSDIGMVRTDSPSTSSPQSISGLRTSTQRPFSRTLVGRFVVE